MWCNKDRTGSHDEFSGRPLHLPLRNRSKLGVAYLLHHPLFTLSKETADSTPQHILFPPFFHLFILTFIHHLILTTPQTTYPSSNHIKYPQHSHTSDWFQAPSLRFKTLYPTPDFTMQFTSFLFISGILALASADATIETGWSLQRLDYWPSAADFVASKNIARQIPSNSSHVPLSVITFTMANPYPEPSFIQCTAAFNKSQSAPQQP